MFTGDYETCATDYMDLYNCGRIIGHFNVHRMVAYILPMSSTVAVDDSCELLKYQREGQWPMDWYFPV